MLAQGYFEVAGLTDPDRPTWIYDLLARYEGLHVIAIGVDDIDLCYADLRSRDIEVPPPASLFRDVEIDGKNHVAEFKHVRTNFDQFPEARFVFVQHATPDLLWRPHLLSHRNGALSLQEVQLGTDQFVVTVKNLERLFGIPANLEDGWVGTFNLARGALKVFSSAALTRTYGDLDYPRFPSVTGCRFDVADMKQLQAFLGAAEVRARGTGERLWIAPKDANGMILEFGKANDA
jgi:hypothetical protein